VVVAMAHGAPIFHGLLWFAAVGTRDLWLRVSVGFVELILLSAISAEFYISISIMFFVLLASLMISCSLIRNEARDPKLYLGRPKPDRAPDRDALLPASFLSHGFLRSIVVMVLALIIFPLLPRKSGLSLFLFPNYRVGYTEDVNVTGRKAMTGAGTGDIVMRFYLADHRKDQGKLLASMYLGLIRGRVLSEFDGAHWRAGERGVFEQFASPATASPKVTNFELIREPLTSVIPLPYATRNVWRYAGSSFLVPERASSGEWVDPQAASSSIRVQFSIEDNDPSMILGTGPNDEPLPSELRVPWSVDTHRLRKLAEKIMPGKLDAREKALRLARYFATSGFTGSVTADSTQDAIEGQLRMNGIEKFLFASKSGHCELFATSAALLLRMRGVATRLVTGFRISAGPSGDTLAIRTGDAHAWLEYFDPGHGWRIFDPTPRMLMAPQLLGFLRDFYEEVSTYWYRYVFNFDTTRSSLFSMKTLRDIKVRDGLTKLEGEASVFISENRTLFLEIVLAGLAFSAMVTYVIRRWFPWVFSIRGRVREGPWPVKTERVHMERYLRRTLGHAVDLDSATLEFARRGDPEGEELYRRWLDAYLELRFGPPGRRAGEVRQHYVAVAKHRAKSAVL
jgi:transglutaminase-like putative cysteine protease